MKKVSKSFSLITTLRRNMFQFSKSRLAIMGFILVGAILFLGGVYWMVEKPYADFTYLDALEAIAIFTISGFDTDPPQHILGWAAAIFSLMFGIVLVGSFTAEIASIFVESRLKNHSAVKNINFSNHIIICGYLSDPHDLVSQFFDEGRAKTKDKLVFLFPYPPSPQMENFLKKIKYRKKIKYVIGSPLITEDLARVNAHLAKAAFIFTNRFVEDYDKQDSQTILTGLSIENYNKDIDTYAQLLKTKNLDSLLAAGIDNYITLDSLSSNLFAYSCLNPGLSELIRNLLMACDYSFSEFKFDAKEEKEYLYGSNQEIYKIKIGDGLIGKTFSQVSSILYNEYGLAAIAIERENDKSTLSINPGSSWEVKRSDRIFVLTNNYKDALKISKLNTISKDVPNAHLVDTNKIKHDGWKGNIINPNNAVLDKIDFDNHIIICGQINNLELIINPLRSADLIDFQRIVILNTAAPTDKEWKKLSEYNEIYFVEGSSHIYEDLDKVNISKADKAIILSDTQQEITKGEENFYDAETIMSVMAIETMHPEVYTIAELLCSSSTKFVKPGHEKTGNDDNKFSVDEVIDISMIANSLIMQEYNHPHTTNIFNELFAYKNQDTYDEDTCEVYQIPIPKQLIGKTYKELFSYLSLSYDIIPIGLYRMGSEDPFIFTNPSGDVLLNEADKAYVLAPYEPVVN